MDWRFNFLLKLDVTYDFCEQEWNRILVLQEELSLWSGACVHMSPVRGVNPFTLCV